MTPNSSLSPQQPAQNPPPASTTTPSPPPPSHPHTPSTRSFATFSRHISASSTPVVRGGSAQRGSTVNQRDAIFYEQQEERPLVHMEELGMRNAPITHITASPMPRRSRLSRLSSMIIPSDGDYERVHSRHEGRVHRRRSLHRDSLEVTREGQRRRSRRSSLVGAVSPGAPEDNRRGRRRELAPISGPIPLRGNSTIPSSFLAVSSRTNAVRRQNLHMNSGGTHRSSGSNAPPVSRLARFRRSISLSLDAHPSVRRLSTHDHGTQTPPQRPARDLLPNSDFTQLPSLHVTDPTADFTTTMSSSEHNTAQEPRHVGPQSLTESIEGNSLRTRGPSWTDRWSDRSPVGRRESRRVSSMLGGRSTRLLRRDHDGPLPRILSLAAFAIAAQLTGSTEQTAGDLQAIGPDDIDGNLHNLFGALQTNLHRAAGESAAVENGHASGRPTGPATPLNYLRVFRFVSDTTSSGGQLDSSTREPSDDSNRAIDRPATTEGRSENSEGRTVTLVVVGVRSVPSEEAAREAMHTTETGLNPLLELPPLTTASNFLNSGAGGLLRNANGRSRLAHRRRASSGGITTFPANYDSQRHQRALSTSRSPSVDATPVSGSVTPSGVLSVPLSDSPAGPHPPPSTPAEPGLSAYSSQVTTPSRRPSSASAIHQPHLPIREAAVSQVREAAAPITEDQEHPVRPVQQRRRSDSEFARHRDLGAGAARRNGVVAPDDGDTAAPTATGSRSWLIYVVGTNLAQDHPALTAPSLFTDVSISMRDGKDN